MNDAQTLDTAAISAYLADRLPGFGGPVETFKFDIGASNPTFILKTPAGNYVLRRKPPGQLLKSAHAVDREFRVQSALANTPVPVPRMHLLCEDDAVIGSSFYVMEHIVGRNIREPMRAGETNAERGGVIDEMGRVLAELHSVDVDAVGLSDYGPPGNYFERQVGRWTKQYRASQTNDFPGMERLMAALVDQMPADDGQRTLVHGDYRIDNMMFDKDSPRCLAVLDWELSTLGHPYSDLGSVIMQWQMPAADRGLGDVDRAALGFSSDEEFIARYCERRGVPMIENIGYYVAFCYFRMAGIMQGVHKRALDGNASNPRQAGDLNVRIPLFADNGLAALEW